MTSCPMISPTSSAFDTLVPTAAVYSVVYSFLRTTLIIVMRLFWCRSLMRAKPEQNCTVLALSVHTCEIASE